MIAAHHLVLAVRVLHFYQAELNWLLTLAVALIGAGLNLIAVGLVLSAYARLTALLLAAGSLPLPWPAATWFPVRRPLARLASGRRADRAPPA